MLAALLITRQVVGNVKESLIPYLKKYFRLAKISFDLYGAVSPTSEDAGNKKDDGDSGGDLETEDEDKKKEQQPQRGVTQVELESSAPPVRSNMRRETLFARVASSFSFFSTTAPSRTTLRCSSSSAT